MPDQQIHVKLTPMPLMGSLMHPLMDPGIGPRMDSGMGSLMDSPMGSGMGPGMGSPGDSGMGSGMGSPDDPGMGSPGHPSAPHWKCFEKRQVIDYSCVSRKKPRKRHLEPGKGCYQAW